MQARLVGYDAVKVETVRSSVQSQPRLMVLYLNIESLDDITFDVRRVAYDDIEEFVVRQRLKHVSQQEAAAAVHSVEPGVAYRRLERLFGNVSHCDERSRHLRRDRDAQSSAARAKV